MLPTEPAGGASPNTEIGNDEMMWDIGPLDDQDSDSSTDPSVTVSEEDLVITNEMVEKQLGGLINSTFERYGTQAWWKGIE